METIKVDFTKEELKEIDTLREQSGNMSREKFIKTCVDITYQQLFGRSIPELLEGIKREKQ